MKALRKLPVPLLLICFVTMLLTSCKKESDTPKSAPISTALTPQKAVYAPFEAVVIKTPKGALGSQPLEGLLDGQKVRVMPADTVAVFIMPDVANGSHKLVLTANGKDYTMPVGVVALTNVQSPNVYFDAIEAEVNRNITAINAQADALLLSGVSSIETQALKQNAQQYAAQFNTYKSTYQSLTVAEKQDYARAMAANKADNDEYEALTAAFSGRATALRGTQTVLNYEAGVDLSAKAFVSLVMFTVAHVPVITLLASLAASPEPFTKVPALIALGIAVTSFMVHINMTRAAIGTLFNKALKPFQDLNVDQATYTNGTDTPVNVTAQYRSLTQNDEASGASGTILDGLLANYKSFRSSFSNLVNTLPVAFRPLPFLSALKTHFSATGLSVYNIYVRFSNVTNPAVTLTQLNQADGSVKVRATTGSTTSQNFTYDLTYTNSGFSTGLTKRVSAQVTAANPYCNGVPLKITGIKSYIPANYYYAEFGVYATGGVAPFFVNFYSPCCGGYNSVGSYIGCNGLDGRKITSPINIFYIAPGRSIQLTCTVTDAQGTTQNFTTTVTN